MLYCSTCSINKRLYYCHVNVKISPQLSTGLISHQNFIFLCSVDWYVSLPYLSYFTCWACFCTCFLPILLSPHCYNTSVWPAWKFHIILLLLSDWIHVIKSPSDISDVLDIFMPKTGFFLTAWYDAKNYTPFAA